MSKTLMIFGGTGFVGGILTLKAFTNWEVIICDMKQADGFGEAGCVQYDITDADAVRTAIKTYKPTAAVNTAAISDIDFA
ncbi:MAG: NAD-dependent epimerase/dehydratase family protein [Spirochaetales bacterium]|nr:MAG: NAD-dependent epimerase/dehydratase family protein [Spirochaetales bacterium]